MSKKEIARTWPIDEPRGYQQSAEFFREYPTRADRHKFYQRRQQMYCMRRMGKGPAPLHGGARPDLSELARLRIIKARIIARPYA